MARTQFVDVADELKNLERKALERRDRFILGVVQGHRREPSKAQKRLLKRAAIINSPQEGRGSLFKFLSPLWRVLTPTQKAVWATAGSKMSLSNWQTFISDNAERIKNSLTLSVPPSELWQVRAGTLLIEAPASEIILKQEHPQSYWIAQKVVGASWKRELVFLNEVFSLPLDLEIRYKADLTAEGSPQVARYMARVWTSYQGEDIETDFAINFNPSTDWTLATLEISGLRGIIIGYTLFLEISGYRGELLFDNIRAVHGGTNWALDPRCDKINQTFEKAFALVPPFWIPVSLPAGASFVSSFPPAL
jgi:hypothetical protein